MNFRQYITRWFRDKWEALKKWLLAKFVKDTLDELYKIATKRTAQAIFALLIGLLLLTVGPNTVHTVRRWINPELPMKDRQISGELTDELTSLPIPRASVGLAGKRDPVVTTDDEGQFVLPFKAHEDSSSIELFFEKEGYEPYIKRHPIPLDKALGDTLQQFTLKPAKANF